jgi:hypothetical protein
MHHGAAEVTDRVLNALIASHLPRVRLPRTVLSPVLSVARLDRQQHSPTAAAKVAAVALPPSVGERTFAVHSNLGESLRERSKSHLCWGQGPHASFDSLTDGVPDTSCQSDITTGTATYGANDMPFEGPRLNRFAKRSIIENAAILLAWGSMLISVRR